MSNERKPLCSDEIITMHLQRAEDDFDLCDRIRNEYEDLITHGHLRLVVEVEAMCGDHGGIEGCSCSECSAPVMPGAWMFCPGCGNKVKWPK